MLAVAVFMILLFSVEGAEGRNFTFNTAVPVGQNITLKCHQNGHENVLWKFLAPASNGEGTILFQSGNISHRKDGGRFLLFDETGRFDLVINSTKQGHAGTYFCIKLSKTSSTDNKKKTSQNVIELAVIIDGPECNESRVSNEGESVWMECFVNFRGNVAPVMKWRNEMSEQDIVGSTIKTFNNRKVESSIKLNTDHLSYGDRISCTTFFNQSSILDDDSTGFAPKYEYVWTSSPLNGMSTQSTNNKETVSSYAVGGNTTPSSEGFDSLPMLMSFIIIAIVLTIIILVVLNRKRAIKMYNGSDQGDVYASGGGGTDGSQTSSNPVFYEDPLQGLDRALHSVAEDVDNIYSADPVVQITNSDRPDISASSSHSNRRGAVVRPYDQANVDLIRDFRVAETIADSPLYADRQAAEQQQQDGIAGSRTQNPEPDGIIYAEMMNQRGSDVIHPSESRDRRQPLFDRSVYAAIDHTVKIISSNR